MNYLIDSHVLLWWVFNDTKLCSISRTIIENTDNTIIVSVVSAWEIATKYRIGKLPQAKPLLENYNSLLEQMRFNQLAINSHHALKAGSLAIEHRDPFDRMLMAQAELENLPLITYDSVFFLKQLQIIPTPKTN